MSHIHYWPRLFGAGLEYIADSIFISVSLHTASSIIEGQLSEVNINKECNCYATKTIQNEERVNILTGWRIRFPPSPLSDTLWRVCAQSGI